MIVEVPPPSPSPSPGANPALPQGTWVTLEALGWNAVFEEEFVPFRAQGWQPARLIRDNKISYGALLADGEQLEVVLAGKVYHDAETAAHLPAVGDWVALELGGEKGETVIRARLRRQTCLSRKAPGRSTEEQVIAANVDVVVIVTDPASDFSPRRLERYFTLIGMSGARPVVLVNKADLFAKSRSRAALQAIKKLNPEAEVFITNAHDPATLDGLRQYLRTGVSVTFVGSSGVGKSSIVNRLLGEDYQWTDDVNEITGKGRHTTTARELIVLRRGGIIIDNPGIREVHMWTSESSLQKRFADLEKLALECKFDNCSHHANNVGCAIHAAVQAGKLSAARLDGFLKLDAEVAKLRQSREKRQATVDRRERRDSRAKSQKFSNRHSREVED